MVAFDELNWHDSEICAIRIFKDDDSHDCVELLLQYIEQYHPMKAIRLGRTVLQFLRQAHEGNTLIEDFNIMIASDDEHEEVFAEIYCRGKFVAVVSQAQGTKGLRIEFPSAGHNEEMVLREVDLEGFQQALMRATKRLAGQRQSESDS